jgi:hypothetical protein
VLPARAVASHRLQIVFCFEFKVEQHSRSNLVNGFKKKSKLYELLPPQVPVSFNVNELFKNERVGGYSSKLN